MNSAIGYTDWTEFDKSLGEIPEQEECVVPSSEDKLKELTKGKFTKVIYRRKHSKRDSTGKIIVCAGETSTMLIKLYPRISMEKKEEDERNDIRIVQDVNHYNKCLRNGMSKTSAQDASWRRVNLKGLKIC